MQAYVKSIRVSELNTKDADGNLLFHAFKSKSNRLAKFQILLKAGVGVQVSDSKDQSVKYLLTQELNSNRFKSLVEIQELAALIHLVDTANYADLLYAQAIGVNLQKISNSEVGPLAELNGDKNQHQLYSLSDIISNSDKPIDNTVVENLRSSIFDNNKFSNEDSIELIKSRHEVYLREHGIVPADDDLHGGYDVNRINDYAPISLQKPLSALRFDLKKSVLEIESQAKTLKGEILSVLKTSKDSDEVTAWYIHNEQRQELGSVIDELLHELPINTEYKAKLYNIKQQVKNMTEHEKKELEYEYFPKPISEIIKAIPVIISPLPNVGSSNPDVMKDITDLISTGRANLEGDSEESVVLLGPTGSGKSTLAHAFAGNELFSVEDEELGGWNIDINSTNGSSSNQARISHAKQSETKIPNKFTLDNGVQIIDSPGFGDTSKIDEITNSFYINEIFRPNSKLKFVLVVNESQLFSNRGNELIQTINNFINCFNNIEPVLGSISLVVTHVSANRKLVHVYNSLKKLMEQNGRVTEGEGSVKSVLETLCSEDISSSHISIFHQPKDNGDITSPTLDSVVDDIDYMTVTEELASASISSASDGYAKELFNSVSDQLNQIIGLITHVISNPYQHITNNENSVFVQTEKTISSLLPSNCDVPINLASKKSPNFVEIEVLKQLRDNLNSIDVNAGTFVEMVPALNSLLEMLMEYCDEAIKPPIANVLYALNQQTDYVVFFSKLCKLKTPGADALVEQFKILQGAIPSLYEEKVKSIELNPDESRDYYQEVIKYLTPYSQDENCKEKLYEANMYLGNYYKTQGNDVEALGFYLNGAELNTTDSTVYQEIGNLFFAAAENIKERGVNDRESIICMKDLYKMALEHYKTCYNVIQAKDCFKQLNVLIKLEQKLAPNVANAEAHSLFKDQAEYLDSMSFDTSTKFWWQAFSQAKDDEDRIQDFKKIAEKSGNDDFSTRAANKNFLKLDEIKTARGDLIKTLKHAELVVPDKEATLLIDKYYQPVEEENVVEALGASYFIVDEENLA